MKVLQLSLFLAGLMCAMSVFAHTERYYNHPGQQSRYYNDLAQVWLVSLLDG